LGKDKSMKKKEKEVTYFIGFCCFKAPAQLRSFLALAHKRSFLALAQ